MKKTILFLLSFIPVFAFSQDKQTINGIDYLLKNGEATVTRQTDAIGWIAKIPKEVEYNGISYKVTQVEENAFEGLSVNTVYFDEDAEITFLPKMCFYNCYALQSITLPCKVQVLENCCFYGCYNIHDINNILRNCDITYLGDYCFNNCSLDNSLIIPSKVTHIGEYCFANNNYLSVVTVSWKNLENVEISTNAFNNIASTSYLNVPNGTKGIYQYAAWNRFTYIMEYTEQCEAPQISLSDNGLKLSSETPDATFVYTITSEDFVENATSASGEIELVYAYTIKARAMADGYNDSEETMATIYFLNASFEKPSGISEMKAKRAVAVSYHNGNINVSGLNEGERVEMYAISGKRLYSGFASQGTIFLPYNQKSQSVVIIKVAEQTIKYLPKE